MKKGITPAQRAEAVKAKDDEELDKLEKKLSTESESSEEESPPSEQEVEEKSTEETEEETPAESEGEEPTEEPVADSTTELVEESDDTPEDVRQLSDKAQKRFRDLAAKNKLQAEELAQSKRVNDTLQGIGYTPRQAQQITPNIELDGKEEVTEEDYKADIAKQADFVVNRRLSEYNQKQKQKDNLDKLGETTKNFTKDLAHLEKTYPELDPENDVYDNELDEFIGDYYDKVKGTTRLKDVAEKIMKVRGKSIEIAKRENVNKVAKQASQQAISPGGDTEIAGKGVTDKIKEIGTSGKSEDEAIKELEALESELS